MPRSIPDALHDIRSVGITPTKLADLLGVHRPQINRWEAGEQLRDIDLGERIHTLAVAIDTLRRMYDGDDDRVMGWFLAGHPGAADKAPWRLLENDRFDSVARLARKDAEAVSREAEVPA